MRGSISALREAHSEIKMCIRDSILGEEDLHIPHIEMHKRDFVLKPLAQIAPYVRHPVLMKTVGELAEALQD